MTNKYAIYLYLFIISLPFIDLLTTVTMQFPLSFGAVFRALLIFLMLMLLLIVSYRKTITIVLFIGIPYIFLAFSFGWHWMTKDPFLMKEELSFYMKTAYFLTIMLTLYTFRQVQIGEKEKIYKAIQFTTTILASSYWIAIFTGTSMPSYAYDKHGYAGWFFAANELSVIVLILISLMIVIFLYKRSLASLLILSTIISVAPMIGTKTALFGTALIIFLTITGALITKQLQKVRPIVVLGLLFILTFPFTPAEQNIHIVKKLPSETPAQIENISSTNALLSSRDTYLHETKATFTNSSFAHHVFGLGYAGHYENNPKMIEMDFYDLFFSFGFVGTILLLYPFIFTSWHVIRFHHMRLRYIILIGSYLLCLGIAFYVGHVLFAPAVMSYVAILLLMLKIDYEEVGTNE